MSPNVNLRVYRRTFEYIVLLWDRKELNEDQQTNVKVFYIKDGELSTLSVKLDTNEIKDIDKNTAVCIIPHDENKLDPYANYKIIVSLGTGKDIVEKSINILSYGVLPFEEKDVKDEHVQLMGWVEERKRWVKFPLIEVDGTFMVPVVIVKDLTKNNKK